MRMKMKRWLMRINSLRDSLFQMAIFQYVSMTSVKMEKMKLASLLRSRIDVKGLNSKSRIRSQVRSPMPLLQCKMTV